MRVIGHVELSMKRGTPWLAHLSPKERVINHLLRDRYIKRRTKFGDGKRIRREPPNEFQRYAQVLAIGVKECMERFWCDGLTCRDAERARYFGCREPFLKRENCESLSVVNVFKYELLV